MRPNTVSQSSIFKPSGLTWRLGKCDQKMISAQSCRGEALGYDQLPKKGLPEPRGCAKLQV
jgi:hypothetical protein